MGYPTKFYINCPFYQLESKTSIVCEGVGQAIKNKMVFETEEQKVKHVKTNCTCPFPEHCELFTMLVQKYADNQDETD